MSVISYTEALRAESKGTKRNIAAVYHVGMKPDFWKVQGQSHYVSGSMDPADVAEIIVNAVLISKNILANINPPI